MEISISSRHADLSPALRETTRSKLSRLERLGFGVDRADVHFYEEQNPRIAEREVCEVALDGRGRHVHAKVAAADGFQAVEQAAAKLEHQLAKLKGRARPTGT